MTVVAVEIRPWTLRRGTHPPPGFIHDYVLERRSARDNTVVVRLSGESYEHTLEKERLSFLRTLRKQWMESCAV